MMDTSENYVKMCEKAEEIQKVKRGSFEDFYGGYNNRVWLPRQDQLQEMVKTADIIYDCSKFFGFVAFYTCEHDKMDEVKRQVITMEQLWLAFVMSEKYRKVWDGNEWQPVQFEGDHAKL